MERRFIYFPEPTNAALEECLEPRELCERDRELKALTASIRLAEALAGNFARS